MCNDGGLFMTLLLLVITSLDLLPTFARQSGWNVSNDSVSNILQTSTPITVTEALFTEPVKRTRKWRQKLEKLQSTPSYHEYLTVLDTAAARSSNKQDVLSSPNGLLTTLVNSDVVTAEYRDDTLVLKTTQTLENTASGRNLPESSRSRWSRTTAILLRNNERASNDSITGSVVSIESSTVSVKRESVASSKEPHDTRWPPARQRPLAAGRNRQHKYDINYDESNIYDGDDDDEGFEDNDDLLYSHVDTNTFNDWNDDDDDNRAIDYGDDDDEEGEYDDGNHEYDENVIQHRRTVFNYTEYGSNDRRSMSLGIKTSEQVNVSLIVIYAWLALVVIMIFITVIVFKYKPILTSICCSSLTFRRKRQVSGIEEVNTLLTHPLV